MADTKIGDAANIDVVADGDEFAIADASAATAIVSATALQIKNYVLTASLFAAGTASADSWPRWTAGTLLTTPQVGAIELDANCFYATTDAGNRGVVVIEHFTRLAAAYTTLNQVGEQAIFAASAQDTITLETGTYFFTMLVYITGMSATSGNLTLDILGAGTAALASVLYTTDARDLATGGAAGTDQIAFQVAAQAGGVIATAGTGTACGFWVYGTFQVTTGGTMIPSIALVTAAAASVVSGSHFRCHRAGAVGVTAVGQWS